MACKVNNENFNSHCAELLVCLVLLESEKSLLEKLLKLDI